MALSKLGAYIELLDNRNADLQYGEEYVRGVNNLKLLMPTKADISSRDLSKFYIVYPGDFVFNHRTSRNGSKFSIAFNDTDEPVICTEDYVVFRIKEECKHILHPIWLYMYFNRAEFDRYVITNSWGSSTEFYNWEDICSVELIIPEYAVQKKYVDVYVSMLHNQRSYERGLGDLKLLCDAYIEELRRVLPCEEIGPYLAECNERNIELLNNNVQGVNNTSNFGETKADTAGLDFHNYKIVRRGNFAYNPSRINLGSIALLRDEDCIVSPMYIVFAVTNTDVLLPEYLMMWFGRSEFQRSTLFYAAGSVRDTFSFDVMKEVQIPIPKIEIQKDIVAIYNAYVLRKDLNIHLKEQLRNICPILIKGSIEETSV